MSTFTIKQNDTSPSLQVSLTDSAGSAIDLTGATSIRFHMRLPSATAAKVDAAAATVGASTAGVVKYDWSAGDTDTAGLYQAEFEVTYSDSSIETFPNGGYLLVNVLDDLA